MNKIEDPKAEAAISTVRSGQAWEEFIEAIRKTGEIVYDDPRVDSDRMRAEGLRYLMRVLNISTDVAIEVADPAYPRLLRLYDTYRNMANCNPDCIYLYARISPDYTYKIKGSRGSALMFEIATMDADMLAYPEGRWLKTVSTFDVDVNGALEITLSAEPHETNWVPLDPEARWIYVRQYFYDWDTETPAQLTIERIGAIYPPPAPAPEKIANDFQQMTKWIPTWYRGLTDSLAARFYASPPDEIVFSAAKGGFEGISYGRGHFTCGPLDAVIVEFEPPENTLYWSIHLGTHNWESLDWDLRQCSLNGHQAWLNRDGKFRGVIALSDPGIPNWLDPADHQKGLICCRIVRGKWVPEVKLHKISLVELRKYLPDDTPVISRDQRQEIIYKRMLAVQRRCRE